MRVMRSSLPIFLLVGLAMISIIGVIILQAGATAAVSEVNDTAKEELSLGMYEMQYGLAFGIGALLLIVAGYFALRYLG
jgi:hypothetical protein